MNFWSLCLQSPHSISATSTTQSTHVDPQKAKKSNCRHEILVPLLLLLPHSHHLCCQHCNHCYNRFNNVDLYVANPLRVKHNWEWDSQWIWYVERSYIYMCVCLCVSFVLLVLVLLSASVARSTTSRLRRFCLFGNALTI